MADALGFPDATDTGVQAGVTLKAYNGDLIINTPGAVISGLDIHGSVIINADNVTLMNCRITSSDYFIVSVGGGGRSTGGIGCVIENCEIIGGGNTQGSAGIQGAGTFLANNIYGVENGIVFGGRAILSFKTITFTIYKRQRRRTPTASQCRAASATSPFAITPSSVRPTRHRPSISTTTSDL